MSQDSTLFCIIAFIIYIHLPSFQTSRDRLAHYNDAYMRLPHQAAHGWCLRTYANIDPDTGRIKSLNDVYFGMDDGSGKFNISNVNPDELPAVTNVYAKQIETQPISLEYTFDWWYRFNDAVFDNNIDSMVELLWEHQDMGLLPEMYSFSYDLSDYIAFFKTINMENRALMKKLSKSAKDKAFIDILRNIRLS